MGRTGLVFVTKMHLISARKSIYVYINKCRQKSVKLKFSFPIIYPFHGVILSYPLATWGSKPFGAFCITPAEL